MFYMQYLSSLCQRRQWPEPMYQPYTARQGFQCVVRVNNREYHTDRLYESEVLATENAAMRAYLICRNFSVNDGRVPSAASRYGAESNLQGRPVAIGTERRGTYYSGSDDNDGSLSSGSRSGGSSPGSAEFPVSYRNEPRRARDTGRTMNYGSGGSRRR